MATRVNRKTAANPSKEIVPFETASETCPDVTGSKVNTKPVAIGKKLARKNPRVVKKASLTLKLKAKGRKTRLNPLAKNGAQKVAATENKKKIIRKSKKKMPTKQRKEDILPVLEPIFPIEKNNIENKKIPKKRGPKKKIVIPDELDVKRIKVETEDDFSLSSDITDISNQDIPNQSKQTKKIKARKIKQEPDSLEDVMSDLSLLIKEEPKDDSMSESGKNETVLKPKKLTKKQRIDLLQKTIIKKENLENTLNKLDSSDEKVIDMLDLNVRRVKRKTNQTKRRHSIEKFSMVRENVENAQISLFQQLPRSISPRSRLNSRIRQGIDGITRRASPYTTRSDSPARMLRNGKQRKLKDLNLLDGLDIDRKRRRLCSDLSEISGSKLSGYESDSSFSDMASSHGTENPDVKDLESKLFEDTEVKPLLKNSCDVENGPNSLSMIDTNSNVCTSNLNDDKITLIPIETNSKVPEKSIILDIMKKTFNQEIPVADQAVEIETITTDTFYGNVPESNKDDDKCINETVISKEISDGFAAVEQEPHVSPENHSIVNEVDTNDEIKESAMETSVDTEIEQNEEPREKSGEMIFSNSTQTESTERDNNVVAEETNEPEMQTDCETNNPNVENTVESVETEECAFEMQNPKIEENIDDIGPKVHNEESTSPENDIIDSNIEINQLNNVPSTDPVAESVPNHSFDYNESVEQEEAPNSENIEDGLVEQEIILKALGLQRLQDAEQNRQKSKDKAVMKIDNYTGTLKTVIKINRDKKKGRKTSAHKIKAKSNEEEFHIEDDSPREHYKIVKEFSSATWKQGSQSSDTAGARKTHYSNRSNLDGSSEHTSDGESAPVTGNQEGVIKALVIPEKASSFSIHPGRLCKDECSYCFGKFGLFDTPCHIAQMKSVERQDKILKSEIQLTRDSCLCDACYRHVDRKANTPSYTNKSIKRNSLVAPGPRQNHCHVLGCHKVSTNILRRKWIIKMRKSICQVINIDLDNPGLHSIPICDEHYSALEHLMLCAMCKRRLAKNHIHYIGPETADLNELLTAEGIPIKLSDKPVVCKFCKCFASILLKDTDDRPENSINFFREYKKRLLHFNDIVPMDEAEAEEPIAVPGKSDKTESSRKKKRDGKGSTASESTGEDSGEQPERIKERILSSDTASQPQSRSESPNDEFNSVDYNTLIPAIAMDCGSDTDTKKETPKPFNISSRKVSEMAKHDSSRDNNQISELAVQKLGSNPSISVRQLFPGEEDLPLSAQIDFQNVKDKTPEGWEKCSSVIQYDLETKRLWQELQKPYGNQSSFMRHLILLEKYFRNGDMILSPRASHHSINYSESVHNRLRAYDNIPSSAGNIQPISMIPFNKMQTSSSGIITSTSSTVGGPVITSVSSLSSSKQPALSVTAMPTSSAAKNSPITLSQLNSPPLIPASHSILSRTKTGPSAPPPGLMPLHPGTTRPVAPLVKVPQPQKIKFPITKNWRPNLIPIDPTKKIERKNGLVQVISGGKPYHITLEDYKKMCAIKRSFEMKQKRLQESQNPKPIYVTHNSMLKSIIPRKGLIISKTRAPASVVASPPKLDLETNGEGENILDKLDKQVEKLESRLNEGSSSLLLPKIPKSLTVIPQTVARKPSRPSSPVLMITPKNKS